MKNASRAHKETDERLEMLKAEGGHLLMTTKSDSSADHARLRMIDEKIKSLSRHLQLHRVAHPK